MPPRRSTGKKPSSVGKRSQQSKITDRKLRTIKKPNDSQQHDSKKLVKSMDVSEDEHDNAIRVKRSKRSMVYDISPGSKFFEWLDSIYIYIYIYCFHDFLNLNLLMF